MEEHDIVVFSDSLDERSIIEMVVSSPFLNNTISAEYSESILGRKHIR